MRNVALALLLVSGAGTILSLLAKSVGLPPEYAGTAAGVPLLAFQKLYEQLEARSAKRVLSQVGARSIITLEEFSVRLPLMFLVALVMVVGLILFTGGLMGIIVGLAASNNGVDVLDKQPKLFAELVIVTSLPLKIIGSLYIGYWIGTRSRPGNAVAVILGSLFFGVCFSFLIAVVFMNDDMAQVMLGGSKTPSAILRQFANLLPDMVLYMVAGLIGVWLGKRQQIARYLRFVTNLLPQDTRETIVEMAREEAIRARPSGLRAA